MFRLQIEKYDSFANHIHLIRLNRYNLVLDVGGGFAQCNPFFRQIRELCAMRAGQHNEQRTKNIMMHYHENGTHVNKQLISVCAARHFRADKVVNTKCNANLDGAFSWHTHTVLQQHVNNFFERRKE